VVVWDLDSGQELFRLSAPEYPQKLAWVDGGQKLAGLFLGGEIRVWDATGKLFQSFQAGQVERVAFSPDGLLVATAGVQGGVKLWDLQTGSLSSLSLIGPDELITALAFSPDSQRLAAAVWDSPIVVWDLSQGAPAAAAPPTSPAQTTASTVQAGWTFLSAFKPTVVELGYGVYSVGTFKFSSEDPADDVHTGDPIRMHGLDYPQGIFAHAPARFTYDLGGKSFTEFQATLGMLEKINCGDGVEFVLLLDDQEIYRSPRLQPWSTPLEIQVPLSSGSQLSLVVEMGNRSNKDCDWAVWGDPRLR
jgi:WD40 repeat protein